MSILDVLAKASEEVCEQSKKIICAQEMKAAADSLPRGDFRFERALAKKGISFICECKKASPSKGLICKDYDPASIAREYEKAGADCLSVLTCPEGFEGSIEHLKAVREAVSLPILRKDFLVDLYQIDQAKTAGADAVLLIASILDLDSMKRMLDRCNELGISALCEAHDAAEIEQCIQAGARVIGVNNRNLKDFTISMDLSENLRQLVGRDLLFVCESGIKTRDDIIKARQMDADAVLIGETMMKAKNKRETLLKLKGLPERPAVKLCGLQTKEDAQGASLSGGELAGLNFCKASSRFLRPDRRQEVLETLSPSIGRVGVFKDNSLEEILESLSGLDMIQVHTDQYELIEQLKKKTSLPVIQAFSIRCEKDLRLAADSPADLVLLDAKEPGSGSVFDWSLIPCDFRDYMLAGGLNEKTIENAKACTSARIYDVCSGIETVCENAERVRSAKKMKEFARLVHQKQPAALNNRKEEDDE